MNSSISFHIGPYSDNFTIYHVSVAGAAPLVRLVRFSPDHFAKLYCKEH